TARRRRRRPAGAGCRRSNSRGRGSRSSRGCGAWPAGGRGERSSWTHRNRWRSTWYFLSSMPADCRRGAGFLRLGDAASAASLGDASEDLGEFADPMVLEIVDELGDLIAQLRLGEGGDQRVEL